MSTRQPLRGYNHNVRHLDMVFHIQTEDSGVKAPHIFTHCFHEGTIVATKKRDYPPDATEEVVRAAMKEQHKELMRELKHGAFDAKIRQYFGGAAAAVELADGADAAAAAAVAEVKRAAYERLLAEAKDLDSALEMELVADEPPPGDAVEAAAAAWPGPGQGAKLPTGPEWPGPGEGAKLPAMPEWPGPGEGAKLPAIAAAPEAIPAGGPTPTPPPTGVAEKSPATTSADWSSVRAVLESAIAEQGDAGLAVATYSPGDLSGPVSVVTFNERASGPSVKPIDLGALPPGHSLPPAPKPRSERSIWAVKGSTKEAPLEESGPVKPASSVSVIGPGGVRPERVEPWPVMERVAAPEVGPPVDSGGIVFHKPGAAPAPPTAAAPRGGALPEPPGVSLRAPGGPSLPEPPGVSLRAPGGPSLPEPPGVSLRAPGGPSLPEPPGVSLRAPGGPSLPEPPGVSLRAPAARPPAAAAPAPPGPAERPTERALRAQPGAAVPAPQSVSLRPGAPPAPAPAAAPPARPPMAAPPSRPSMPASDGRSVSMPSRSMPVVRSEPAPSSQPVVVLKPPAAQQRMPTPARHSPRQYVSIASADGVVMQRAPVMVGGSQGAARAGTRAPASVPAVPRQGSAPASSPAVPRPPAPPPAPVTRSVSAPHAPVPRAPAPPAAASPPPSAPPAEAESIFGAPQQSEKSLHEIILSYLSGEDKPK